RKDHGEMWCDEGVLRVVLCTECLNPSVVCLREGWIGDDENCHWRLPFRLVIGMKAVYTNAEERAKVRPTPRASAAAEARSIGKHQNSTDLARRRRSDCMRVLDGNFGIFLNWQVLNEPGNTDNAPF